MLSSSIGLEREQHMDDQGEKFEAIKALETIELV